MVDLRHRESGSVLLLVPAGILIVIALGAIAVNGAMAFQGERRAANLASLVANDTATLALDTEHFRATGDYALVGDVSAAAERAIDAALSGGGGGFADGSIDVRVERIDDASVRVVVTAEVPVLWRAPGAGSSTRVEATAIATAAP